MRCFLYVTELAAALNTEFRNSRGGVGESKLKPDLEQGKIRVLMCVTSILNNHLYTQKYTMLPLFLR